MATNITASWRSMTGLFAAQMRNRFAWDLDAHAWRKIDRETPHWTVCDWEDDIQPIWVGPFPGLIQKHIRKPGMMLPRGATDKIAAMCDSTQWVGTSTIRMLQEQCKTAWRRNFEHVPWGALNTVSGTVNLDDGSHTPHDDDETPPWTWCLPWTYGDIRRASDAEADMAGFVLASFGSGDAERVFETLHLGLRGLHRGGALFLSGSCTSVKELLCTALAEGLGPLCVSLDERDTAKATLDPFVANAIANGATRIVLAPDGLGSLNTARSGHAALTNDGKVLLVAGGLVPPHLAGNMWVSPVHGDLAGEWNATLAQAMNSPEFGAGLIRWLLSPLPGFDGEPAPPRSDVKRLETPAPSAWRDPNWAQNAVQEPML